MRTSLAIAAIIAAAGTLGACSTPSATDDADSTSSATNDADSTSSANNDPGKTGIVVSAEGQDWECLTVPEDVMGRILDGKIVANGEDVEVEKATMVEGADDDFIAAEMIFPDEADPVLTSFTYPKDGTGPIYASDSDTAQLFNYPRIPQGKLDGSYAAEECVSKM